MVKVTNMTPNASHCEEEAASHILYIHILTHYYMYMCSGDNILYRTIVAKKPLWLGIDMTNNDSNSLAKN